MTRRTFRHALIGYSFLLPGIAGFLLFTIGPIGFSFVLSFFDWNIFAAPVFVDMANYEAIFSSTSRFWYYLGNSLFFLLTVPVQMGIALLIAFLLNENPRGTLVFKLLFFIPVVLSAIPVAMIWGYLLDTQNGLMNALLALFGVGRIAWLFDPAWIRVGISTMAVWQGSAFGTIIYYAALQGIPDHLYEVATLDGADGWQKFRSITMPLLMPTHFFLGITGSIGALQMFAPIYTMTHGMAGGAHNLLVEIYMKGYQEFQMGYAAALSWILFLAIFFLSTLYWKKLRAQSEYA